MKDITGQRFGRLIAIKSVGTNKQRKMMWLCRCDCGNEKIICGDNLRRGETVSCGCKRQEVFQNTIHKHELSDTRIYRIWTGMKNRCYNPKEPAYKWYGGKGIKVCNEWKDNVIAFYEWSINNGYKDNLTIDRIESIGDYCPSNCRWADMKVQSNNRTNTLYFTYHGETHNLREWSEIANFPYKTLQSRIARGWGISRALEQPIRKSHYIKEQMEGVPA